MLGIFGLGFGASVMVIFIIMVWFLGEVGKKAVSNGTVQRGVAHWIFGLFKK